MDERREVCDVQMLGGGCDTPDRRTSTLAAWKDKNKHDIPSAPYKPPLQQSHNYNDTSFIEHRLEGSFIQHLATTNCTTEEYITQKFKKSQCSYNVEKKNGEVASMPSGFDSGGNLFISPFIIISFTFAFGRPL